MKRLFENQKSEVCLMLWPTKVQDRQGVFSIAFYEDKKDDLKTGDVICANYSENSSYYEIVEIKDRRDGAIKSKKYVTANVTWSNHAKISDFNCDNTSMTFKKFFNL